MANPNPQSVPQKFYGVREVGYTQYYEKQDKLAEIMRFGKRMYSDHKMTSEELL